ncbi:hypothetical protein AMECASPLE_037130, partial [Ameca splendens]
ENGAEEDEEYQPPGCQLRSALRLVKHKVAPASRKRSTTRLFSRWVSKATPSPGDDSEDMTLSYKLLRFHRSILQDAGLTTLKHGHRSACSKPFL